jgi:FkbM family methyltransferase
MPGPRHDFPPGIFCDISNAMEAAKRALMALVRFIAAAQNMGLWGAFNVYLRSRWSRRLQCVTVRGIGRFWYRGGTDFGVMSHFYNEGYRIIDGDGPKITRIVDGGANIGVETRRFAYFHPEAAIVAVEPAQSNYDVLERNVREHPSIVPIRAALWPRSAQLAIIPGDTPEGFSVTETMRPDWPICDTITVPDILERMGWSEIDIFKLDIEGAEFELFGSGSQDWIGRVNCFIFECPDASRSTTTARIFAALPSERYRTAICGECLVVIKHALPWALRPQTRL